MSRHRETIAPSERLADWAGCVAGLTQVQKRGCKRFAEANLGLQPFFL
ncbi:hypothetical protein HGI30_00935 [Paenibacillus albicereus]|uniref:Uncharacterized protein n=1 Tax=Paenibacillus albicereus TaxID=2726185 RepID=A0A6H2GT07_9BACL|nr:hypothetical protein [Paenibacillus albicereus]QJC50306.1 hypothetical protein HGI30_00935 [Paenibacillus albicereus]